MRLCMVYVSCVHVWCASGPSRLQPSTLIEPGSQLLVQLLACAALCELLHQLVCLSFANAFTYLMHNRYCSTQSWAVERTAVVYALEKEAPRTPCVTPDTTLCSAHKCGSPVAREFVSTPVLDCTMLACRSGQEHVLLTSTQSVSNSWLSSLLRTARCRLSLATFFLGVCLWRCV